MQATNKSNNRVSTERLLPSLHASRVTHHALLPLAATLGALLVAFAPLRVNLTTLPLSGSTNESLGVFAILLAGWLVWREREQLRMLPAQTDWRGLVLIALSILVALAGYRLVMRFALGVSLVLFAAGSVWWLFGVRWVRHLWFPLLLLVAIVPLPLDLVGAIAFRMQTVVARATAFLAGLLGVPVERVGVTLNVPGHVIQVNEACSGWHSFSAAFWLFLLVLYWQRPKKWVQWLWVIPALFPIAIIANIFRVTTVVVGSVHGQEWLLKSPWHEMLGLGYFMLLVYLLFRYAVPWQSSEKATTIVCTSDELKPLPAPSPTRLWQLAGIAWVMASLVLWTGWQARRTVEGFQPPEVPAQLGEWRQVHKSVEGLNDGYWFVQARYEAKGSPPFTTHESRLTHHAPLQVLLHIPIAPQHRPKRLLNLWLGQGYELVSSNTVSVSLPTRTVPVQVNQFVKGNEQVFVAVTYLHPQKSVTSPVSARWERMKEQLLWGKSKPWLAIGVASAEAKTAVEALRLLGAVIDAWLQQ